MYAIIGIMLCAIFFGACTKINKKFGLKDDNVIEEAFEDKIEDLSGLNIDLSPESKEKD